MPDNSVLGVEFEGVNGEALDELISEIRAKGFLVQKSNREQPRGPYTILETTMTIDELDNVVSEKGLEEVIRRRNTI